jgi:curli biogenesis system outer membrane secretion channel CsgG
MISRWCKAATSRWSCRWPRCSAPPLFGRLDPGPASRRRWITGLTWLLAALFAAFAFTHSTLVDVLGPVVIGLLSGYLVLQYADVRAAYPAALTGRAMAVFTMAMFLGVAGMQWFTGLIASLAAQRGLEPFTAVLAEYRGAFGAGRHGRCWLPTRGAPRFIPLLGHDSRWPQGEFPSCGFCRLKKMIERGGCMIAGFARERVARSGYAALGVLLAAGFAGCAVQTPPVTQKENPQAIAVQKTAQLAVAAQAPAAPTLKRKIALGRITNETNYGQSLLRDRQDDPLGKQVTDLMSKALTESGAYLVFERPDIGRIQAESKLVDTKLNLIGVDALIIGSLTEFGRKVVGASGFVSSSKRQVAFAKVDVRMVDTTNGHVFFATSGAGEASNETASTFGFGSQAGYDGTLNDAAIRQAVSEAVSRLSAEMSARPWESYILKSEGNRVFLGGGKSQGINRLLPAPPVSGIAGYKANQLAKP